MGNTLSVIALVVVLTIAVGAVVAMVPRRRRMPGQSEALHPGLRHLRQVSQATRLGAIVAGAALLVLAAHFGGSGRALMLAPVTLGGCQVLGALIADRLTRPDATTPGVAALELRRARDLLPRGLTRATCVAAAILAGLLIWTTGVAAPDSQGRAGRSLDYRCAAECSHATVGPWPGTYYSVPLAIGVAAVIALAIAAIRYAARRPRNGADPQVLRIDGAVRLRGVERIVAGAGIAITGALAGVATEVGMRLLDADHAPGRLAVMTWPALVLAPASAAVLLWCLTVLLLPGPGSAPTTPETTPAPNGALGQS